MLLTSFLLIVDLTEEKHLDTIQKVILCERSTEEAVRR